MMVSLTKVFRRFRHDEHGGIAIMFALQSVLAVVVVAFALHYGEWSREKSTLQSATDAAALAGTRELIYAMSEGNNNTSKISEEAAAFFKANGFSETPSVSSTTTQPYTVTVVAVKSGDVWIGPKVIPNPPQIVATSTAQGVKAADACVLALAPDDGVGVKFNISGSVVAEGCSIWSNSATEDASIFGVGSGTVDSKENCAVGSAKLGGGLTLTPPVKSGCFPAADPLASHNFPFNDTCGAPSSTTATVTTGGGKGKGGTTTTTITYYPGVYCSNITFTSDNVVFDPGVYYIKNATFKITGNVNVTGLGVTFVFLEGGQIDFSGTGSVELVAPTSGDYKGMVMVSDRTATVQTAKISGGAWLKIEGQMYLPNMNLTYTGNDSAAHPSAYNSLIARTVTFSGSAEVKFKLPPGGSGAAEIKTYRGIVLIK